MTQKRELKRTRRLKRTNSKKHQFRRYGRTRARHHSRSRTRTRTHTRVKRGGMFGRVAGTALANTARETIGTVLLHDIRPFFVKYNQYIVGIDPKPEDGIVVKNGDKFFKSFADIPLDSEIKASIDKFKQEIKDPLQNFDKAVTTFKNLIKILDDRKEKRDKENRRPPDHHPTKFFKSSSSSLSSPLSTLSIAGNTTQSPQFNLDPYIQTPFRSPPNPNSSVVSTTTPPKLPVGAARVDQGDQGDQGDPSQLYSPIQRRLSLDGEKEEGSAVPKR